MIPLSSTQREGRKRIRLEEPVSKGGVFPPFRSVGLLYDPEYLR